MSHKRTVVLASLALVLVALASVAVRFSRRVSAGEVEYAGATRPEPSDLSLDQKDKLTSCRAGLRGLLIEDLAYAEQKGSTVRIAAKPAFLAHTLSERTAANDTVICYYTDAKFDAAVSKVEYVDPSTNAVFGRWAPGKGLKFDR